MKRRMRRHRAVRPRSGRRLFVFALGIAVAIVILVLVGRGLYSHYVPGQPGGVANFAAAPVTGLMPTPAQSLAGFKLFLSRCRTSPDCPYYALSVQGDSLKYVGVRGVAHQGVVREPLTTKRKRRLLSLVRKAGFFTLGDSYALSDAACDAVKMNAPTLKIGVTLNGRTKIVKANRGCVNVPARLIALARGIDRVSRSARWTGVVRAPATATESG